MRLQACIGMTSRRRREAAPGLPGRAIDRRGVRAYVAAHGRSDDISRRASPLRRFGRTHPAPDDAGGLTASTSGDDPARNDRSLAISR
ncbi:hypothetical protein P2H44_12615 [Albimonas sp. CAU 1670]|uniref:hypothetical protein n=1 Tax=Albimonas sp. CAU 1670 TaxID=3032599 RepID=UPI0023D9E0BF|nr:hypothetical protein [Albimonas sp. CAU 1670]MDF2233398.1 hypothetical protein [Albimonas sp. CAU 1670]